MSDDSDSEPSSFAGAGERHVQANPPGQTRKSGPSSTGSRVVAKLSEERLARKRAADRHAQRVLRQKTRQRVEDLEQRIRELTSNPDPESVLQAAKKRTSALQEELQQLREAARIANAKQSSLGQSQLDEYASPQPISATSLFNPQGDIPEKVVRFASESPSTKDATVYHSTSQLPHHLKSRARAAPFASIVSKSTHCSAPVGSSPIQITSGIDSSSEYKSTALVKPRPTYSIPRVFFKQPPINVWDLPLCVAEPATPIDHILTGIIRQQKQLAAAGVSQALAKGPNYPNLNVLVAPHLPSYVHPVAHVLSDLLKRITYRTFVDKVGALLVMYPMYQWQIVNDYDTYAALPSFAIPVLAQRTTPHPVWLCALGWPKLREVCIANQEKYCNEEFQFIAVRSLNCNWRYGIQAALRRTQGGFTVTREFWEHVRILDNWSFDEPFQSRFPELEEFCKFTKYPQEVGS